MKQILFLTFIVLLFTGCFGTKSYNYSTQQNQLSFKIKKEQYYHYDLVNPQFTNTFDHCTSDSYTISDASLFLEYIALNSNCKWNGASNGFFEYQMKEKLKLKSLSTMDRFEVGQYTFSTLRVNDTYKLQTIHYWSTFTDLFIIDYDGVLTFKLLKEFNAHDKLYKSTLPRFVKRYNQSLVKWNFIKSYFNQESGDIIVK